MWLSVLQMAEAWGMHPEQVMQTRRGALWARRWATYQDIKARIEKGGKPAPAEPDGEPEWVTLERQMKAQGS